MRAYFVAVYAYARIHRGNVRGSCVLYVGGAKRDNVGGAVSASHGRRQRAIRGGNQYVLLCRQHTREFSLGRTCRTQRLECRDNTIARSCSRRRCSLACIFTVLEKENRAAVVEKNHGLLHT